MAERWNPLDLEKLDPDSTGLSECMAWGIEAVKVLAEIIQDLDRSENVDPEETNRNRRFYLCHFMTERLDQIESFMGRLEQKLLRDEKQPNNKPLEGKKVSVGYPGNNASVPAMEKSA